MYIIKCYAFLQNLEGMAQKLGLPRPFQFLSSQGHGSPIYDLEPSFFLQANSLAHVETKLFLQLSSIPNSMKMGLC